MYIPIEFLEKMLQDNLKLNQSLTENVEKRLLDFKEASQKKMSPYLLELSFETTVFDIKQIDKSFREGNLLSQICLITGNRKLFDESTDLLLQKMNNAEKATEIGHQMMRILSEN